MKIFRDKLIENIKKSRGRPKGSPGTRTPNDFKSLAYPQKKYIKINRFVDEYLIDLNGLRAYQRCGYGQGNDNTDAMASSKLLNRPSVIQLIAEREEARSKKVNITQEMVLKELALLAFCNIRDISNWDGNSFILKSFSELTRDQTAIISSIKIQPRQWGGLDLEFKTPSASDKRTALIDLGKHLGLFIEGGDKEVDPLSLAKRIRLAEQQINATIGGAVASL